MADSTENPLPNAMDYPAHDSTFELFIRIMKWGTLGTVIILIGMAIFLL